MQRNEVCVCVSGEIMEKLVRNVQKGKTEEEV